MYLYFAEHKTKNSPVKIGVTSDIDSRMSQLCTGSPWGVQYFHFICFKKEKHAYEAELMLHRLFSKNRMNGEWFSDVNAVFADGLINQIYGSHEPDRTLIDHSWFMLDSEMEFFSIAAKNLMNCQSTREINDLQSWEEEKSKKTNLVAVK